MVSYVSALTGGDMRLTLSSNVVGSLLQCLSRSVRWLTGGSTVQESRHCLRVGLLERTGRVECVERAVRVERRERVERAERKE